MLFFQLSFFILFFMVCSILIHVQHHAISVFSSPIVDKGYLFSETAKVGHLGNHLDGCFYRTENEVLVLFLVCDFNQFSVGFIFSLVLLICLNFI